MRELAAEVVANGGRFGGAPRAWESVWGGPDLAAPVRVRGGARRDCNRKAMGARSVVSALLLQAISGRMSEDLVGLHKARSLLVILLATCNQTLLALDAVGNVLDTDMTEDLRRMITRTESELEGLVAKLAALR
jgi:hypothetical protein